MSFKTIVLTGGNKGIGFHTTKDLALKKEVGRVIFTYRNEEDGKKAMAELTKKYKVPQEKLDMHQLEVTSQPSIDRFYDFLKSKYGEISILINNAGLAIHAKDGTGFHEETNVVNARRLFNVNFEGPVAITEKLYPLISKTGRIVHVASLASDVKFTNVDLRNTFWKAKSISDLRIAYKKFMEAIGDGTLEEKGYDPKHIFHAYGMSKLCLVVATRLQAEKEKEGRIICSLCPGFIKTNLSCYNENAKSIDQASVTTVHVVMNASNDWHGGFFHNKDNRINLYQEK